MRKITIIFLVLITSITVSCSSSDDEQQQTSLQGTAWFGTGDDDGEVYTFSSASNFTFSGDGATQNGTYTFNGTSGTLNHTDGNFGFTISGDVLTVDNGNSSIYIKQ